MGKWVSTTEEHNCHFCDYGLFLCSPTDSDPMDEDIPINEKSCGVVLQAYSMGLWMEGWKPSLMPV